MILEDIIENYPDEQFLKADGFDAAIIGFDPNSGRLVYSRPQMISVLILEQEMNLDDAIEYLEFNVWNAYVGEKTPIYIEI
jgi:hypothetical protein